MSKNKYPMRATILILLAFIIATTVAWYWTLWPFTKGSNIPAFLGTTFEMTVPEVQRTLKKSGIQLVDQQTFKNNYPDLSKNLPWFLDFKPLLIEDSPKTESWYMPPLEMFNSYVVGEFNFNNDRLSSVDLSIFPFKDLLSEKGRTQDNEKVVAAVTASITKNHAFIKTEPSKTVPGAYDQFFEGNGSKVTLWINLTNPNDPIINIYIIYTKEKDFRKTQIQKREKNAF